MSSPRSSAVASLSPSRAGDFESCPLLYRFRVIDRLPEKPSRVATRGTLVHAVLERLYDLPAVERTLDRARALLAPEWRRLLDEDAELAALFADDSDGQLTAEWMDGAPDLLATYFRLEDPTRLQPADRELLVEAELESGLRLRGVVDRLDRAADGAIRVVDYKTGKAPPEAYEQRALFQMRFYALVLWRQLGVVPTLLQLIYLGSGEVVSFSPDEADLRATARKLDALWAAIRRADETGDWRPNPSRRCEFCDHQVVCPAWGGTPPPLPEHDSAAAAAGDDAVVLSPRSDAEDV